MPCSSRRKEALITLGGEVRDVTVLFCDIRNFTQITQGMPPGEVIDMINEHMTALTAVVKEHNGVLDKFVGDLLMAVFGAPIRQENYTFEAARCALHLQAERQKLNETSRHKLQVGIGLATGEVLAGCMGSTARLNYTVLGERVNLASRLCDEARASAHRSGNQRAIEGAHRDGTSRFDEPQRIRHSCRRL
jgi:class 3 adenylate cyclase